MKLPCKIEPPTGATPEVKRGPGDRPPATRFRGALAQLCISPGLTACAVLPPALMELPVELSGTEAHMLAVPGTRTGHFELSEPLGGGTVRFERSADRWSFFDTADIERAALKLRLEAAGRPALEQQCLMRRTGLQGGGVGVELQPSRLLCEGAGTRVEPKAHPGALRAGRTGSVISGAQTLEIRSAHRIQGTPLMQDEPVGYLLLQDGKPAAALDLLGSKPVLRVAALTPDQQQAVVQAALLLALSWEPAR